MAAKKSATTKKSAGVKKSAGAKKAAPAKKRAGGAKGATAKKRAGVKKPAVARKAAGGRARAATRPGRAAAKPPTRRARSSAPEIESDILIPRAEAEAGEHEAGGEGEPFLEGDQDLEGDGDLEGERDDDLEEDHDLERDLERDDEGDEEEEDDEGDEDADEDEGEDEPAAAGAAPSLPGVALRHLRALGHAKKPVIHVGKAGVTPSLVAEAARALLQHELVKVRVLGEAPVGRQGTAEELAAATGAVLAQVLGRTFLLYKRHPKKPKIVLPTRAPKGR